MKNLFLFFSLLVSFFASSQMTTIFTEDFVSNPFISGTATTTFPQTTGGCSNDTYEVATTFNASCGWGASWPPNSTASTGILMINNGGTLTGGTVNAAQVVYERTFTTTCTSQPQLSLRATKRNMGSTPSANFTIFLNGNQVGQFSLSNVGQVWQNVSALSFGVPLLSGSNTIRIEQDALANALNVDYAFDDIALRAGCCLDSIDIIPHGEFDCEHPDNQVPLLVVDENGTHLTGPNFSFAWSNGQNSSVINASIQDLPIWVTVTNIQTGCVSVDSFFYDCCIDSISIGLDGDDPCDNPDDNFTLYVYDINGNILNPGPWQISWTNGSNDNHVNVSLADMPISVTAFNEETGCTYTATYNVSCCLEMLSIVPSQDDPCSNPSDPFQLNVFDQFNNQLYQGQYTFLWSNGSTTDFVNVTVANLPISVTVFNTETDCEYSISYTLDCCPDTVIIEPICLNPCEYPGLQIPFHVVNGVGTVLSSPNYSFNWSNGSTDAFTSATSAQLPLTVTVIDLANGCVYSTTYTDPCCSMQISSIVLDPTIGPCNPWGWDIQVVNSFGTQLTSPSFSFLWSTGSTSQTETVSYGYNFNIPVTITDNINGCVYNTAYIDGCPPDNFGPRSKKDIQLSSFPNPAKNQIAISFTDNRDGSELQIGKQKIVVFNASGIEVFRGAISTNTRKEIDVSNLAPGLYLCNVIENNQVIASDKFVKLD